MDHAGWYAAKQPDNADSKYKQHINTRTQGSVRLTEPRHVDHLNTPDVDRISAAESPPAEGVVKAPPATPCTPQECATMVNAVEEAIKNAHDVTPDSGAASNKLAKLQAWLEVSGLQMPTPAAKDLESLSAAAADSRRLKKQLEALREAELELAAREAEENAENFAVLEEENLSLSADNARLQQEIAQLEALNKAATEAAQQREQQACKQQPVDEVESRAALVLQRAEHTRRLSGVFEKRHLDSLKQLDDAEEQLSAVKALTPSSRAQQKEVHRRLLQAEQEVHTAAAAAQEAAQKLQQVLDEKERMQQELQEIKQQLEIYPLAQQHAELYKKLTEAHQAMLEEKQQHQRLTNSLLEHTGRLSHKYYALSDDYGDLEQRYRRLSSTNEQLASQLKEAHEVLYELQAAVQATPPAKRREQQHLVSRVVQAEQAVKSLEQEKRQLHERLLQAQAFIACLGQRTADQPGSQQQQATLADGASMHTPVQETRYTDNSTTPVCDPAAPAASVAQATAANQSNGEPVQHPAAAVDKDVFAGFITPIKGSSNPLFDLPETPRSILQAESAPAALGGCAHLASFPEPVSPILAAATEALSAAVGQQQVQQIQLSAASHELQTVQQEQLGLREEIGKAKSALADIAGQLRASICGSSAHASAAVPPHTYGSSKSRSSCCGEASIKTTSAAFSKPAVAVSALRPAISQKATSGSSSSSSGSNQHSLATSIREQSSLLPAARPAAPQLGAAGAQCAGALVPSKEFTFPQLSSGSSICSGVCSAGAAQQQVQGSSSAASRVQPHQVASSSKGTPDSLGFPVAAAAGSESRGKGSLSLDDLIRDAESVSLEYGISPHGDALLEDTAATLAAYSLTVAAAQGKPCAGNKVIADNAAGGLQPPQTAAEAAARGVALAIIQQTLTQESKCSAHGTAAADVQRSSGLACTAPAAPSVHIHQQPQTPHSVAGSTRDPDEPSPGLHWQQEPADEVLMRRRLAECLADTPGSASSTAGGAAATVAARKWLQQQAPPTPMASLEETPWTQPAVNMTAADMQSAAKPADSAAHLAAESPAAVVASAADVGPLQLVLTPLGAEGCASNYLPQQPPQAVVSPEGPVSQQRSLVTPSYATPTAVANQRAAIGGLFADDEAAADDAISGANRDGGCKESMADTPLHQQQLAISPAALPAASDVYLTPAAGIVLHNGRAPVRQQPSVDAQEVEAASSHHAAVWTPPLADAAGASGALQSAAAALLASISPAGLISPGEAVPVHILQQMTPEWLKDLRKRCQQGTLQVRELRKQLGLATPEAAAGPQAAEAHTSSAAESSAASEAANPDSYLGVCPAAREGTWQKGGGAATPSNDRSAVPAGRDDEAYSQYQDGALDAAAAAGSVSQSAHSQTAHSALSETSSRSNMDKLRRRAIAQAAAAAAAAEATTQQASAAGMGTVILGADVAAAAAASCEELERANSAGSLAHYMQQDQEQQGQQQFGSDPASSCHSRQLGLEGPSPFPPRPDCPTPGSGHSVSLTPAASSPDQLLAGLHSSRALAKQLQQQLQRHLDTTSSLPDMPKHGSTASGSAAACEAPADDIPVQTPRASSRLAGPARGEGDSAADVSPGASSLTPGAMLNASAESQMLSPSVQLDQVFEASLSQSQQAEGQLGVGSVDSYNSRQGRRAALDSELRGGCSSFQQSISCSSGSSRATLPAGVAVAATIEPRGDAAVTAHPLPEMSSVSTNAPSTDHSVRAHQLSSVVFGTHTSEVQSMHSHTPCMSDSVQAHSTHVSTMSNAAAASQASDVSQCTADSGPSLGSWVGSQAAAAALGGVGAEVSSYPVEVTPGISGITAGSGVGVCSGSVLQSSGLKEAADTSSSAAVQAQYINLGDSPSSTRMTDGTAAEAASHAITATMASQASTACTPSSCCTSQQVLGVSLGASPDHLDKGPVQGAEVVPADSAAADVHGTASRQQTASSRATAPQHAASSCTDISSCRYATPAMDFGTPACSSAKQEVYYTGLQHTSRSVAGRPGSAHKAAEALAFSGFLTGTDVGVVPASATAETAAEDRSVKHMLLLQQLLESPSSSCASIAGSPAWATSAPAPGNSECIDPTAPDTTTAAPASAGGQHPEGQAPAPDSSPATAAAAACNNTCSRGSQTPAAHATAAARGAGVEDIEAVANATAISARQLESPALPYLDIPNAPTSADIAAVQQQQGSQDSSGDLTGMTFEQRMELLCVDSSSSDTKSPSPPAGADTPTVNGGYQAESMCHIQTPVLPAHVMCRATQTSPLVADTGTQRWPGRSVETQVTPKPGGGHAAVPGSMLR